MAQDALVIEHPNREKAESRATKTIVVALLLLSAAIMAIVTVGGWDTLQGAKSLQIAYILVYVVLVPLQVLLIVFAARGFSQKWSVEIEHSAGPGPRAPQPA